MMKEMDMSKTFTVAGVSVPRGRTDVTWRFANGTAKARTKVLEKNGDHDIRLYDLPQPMSKDAAQDYVTLNYLGAKPKAEAPKAAAKAVSRTSREAKKEAAKQEAAARKVREKELNEVQAKVDRSSIEFTIDESDIPEFIKADFRRKG